jgi:hypothetical protein
MSKATTGEAEVLRLRQSIETQMRRRILEAIELLLEQIGSFRSIVGEAPDAGIEPACPSIESNTYSRNKCLRGASWTFASESAPPLVQFGKLGSVR